MLEKDLNTIDQITLKIDQYNNRLIVQDNETVPPDLPEKVIRYASEKGLEKIMVTCHEQNRAVFEDAGFNLRAVVRGFFKGKDAFFLTAFTDGEREVPMYEEEENQIIKKCMKKKPGYKPRIKEFTVRYCNEEDIPQMINLFKTVFETYPTRIFDANYLKKQMEETMLYIAAVEDGKIISVAAADMDNKNLNAEITDCATYPGHRGRGLLSVLIHSLEHALQKKGFMTVYSLSRAISTGVNMVFRKLGYEYNGRLINHCDICGKYEDLNVWSKRLKRPQ